MAGNSTVAAMTAASALDGTELMYSVQGGNDRKATSLQVKTLAVGAGNVAVATGKTLTVSNSGTLAGGDAFVLAVAAAKTLTCSNTLTLAGTDATVMTFPTTSATLARTDAANTFTGASTATSWNLVTPALGTPSSGNLSNCTAYPFSSLTGSVSIAQLGSTSYAGGFLVFRASGVNFNSANTDTAITISLPTGFSRYVFNTVRISHASGTLTTATAGVFTAAAGAGTAIVTGGSAITVSTASESTVNNSQSMTIAVSNTTTTFNETTLYFRVGTAQGSAATGDVTIIVVAVS